MLRITKMLIAVAAVALLASPALAQPTASSTVTIDVASYIEIVVAPGALDLTVTSVSGGAGFAAQVPFSVQGNTAFSLRVDASETSSSVEVVAGQLGGLGYPYPTATQLTGQPSEGAKIGYGCAVTGDLAGAWGDTVETDPHILIPVSAGRADANLYIASYISGGRVGAGGVLVDDGVLAPPGIYTGSLTLTLSL